MLLTVKQYVQAHCAGGAGLLRGTSDARVGSELGCRTADLEPQVDATTNGSAWEPFEPTEGSRRHT